MEQKLKHPRYLDDPDLTLRVITMHDGQREYQSNCVRTSNRWHLKYRDATYLEDSKTWVQTVDMVYDHELKENVSLHNTNIIRGIVGVSATGAEVYGYFTANPYNNCIIFSPKSGENTICINEVLLKYPFYTENKNTGYYVKESEIIKLGISVKNYLEGSQNRIDNAHQPYNIEDNTSCFERAKFLHDNYALPIQRDIRLAASNLKGPSFGAELETVRGHMPQHILNRYGVIICKDGSIRGGEGSSHHPAEYVTIPLSGAKGIQTLRNASAEISKRNEIDIKCSYHLHIGGITLDRLFIVSLFKLCIKIQKDVFKMLPYYKLHPEGVKSKNYCKLLPSILTNFVEDSNFNEYVNNPFKDIYVFLSGGLKPDESFNRTNHQNPWGEGKWNIKTRYYWVNFVNLIFHKRETIEFRVHTPTLNGDKVMNWLFMCGAIIKYAERHPKRCISERPITFVDVLNYYNKVRPTNYNAKLSSNLIEYYDQRCAKFTRRIAKNDHTSPSDIIEDKDYTFNALDIK